MPLLESTHHFIFFGAALVVLSIVAGMVSSRVGAPLLLVFLGLGMLAGEDGPGGVPFSNFHLTYLVGSMALAIVLFDGGLRTRMSALRLAVWPSLALATVGVVVTGLVVGAAVSLVLGLPWLQAMLIGAIVSSTDAAAVFFLLHLHGTEIKRRVSATLEVESGLNDPMAVFLTVALVEAIAAGAPGPAAGEAPTAMIILGFLWQMGGGVALGVAGGYGLMLLVNRIVIAAGLYPILCAAGALTIFGGAPLVGASGFLAVYVAGLVLGNRRHRAHQVISRFHDGLAWLAQIIMFLVLGLLVTPTQVVADVQPILVVAGVLIFLARPVAVAVCLWPFRFSWQERMFIGWVGLRGAVAIFLACIPVLALVDPAGKTAPIFYFHIAFGVVLASLLIQGWTVSRAARWLGLEVPPPPEPLERGEIDLPTSTDREAAGWRVARGSPALDHRFAELHLPRRTRVIAVIREGTLLDRATLDRLIADDYVIALTPPEHLLSLDKLFAARTSAAESASLGAFVFDAATPLAGLADLYDLPVVEADQALTLGAYVTRGLAGAAVVGDRLALGPVELVVAEMDAKGVVKIGLELTPQRETLPVLLWWNRLKARWWPRAALVWLGNRFRYRGADPR